MTFEKVFLVCEIIGIITFAITGVITALEKKLDIFGAIVLGLVTAVGGGIIRDIMLGYLPPLIFRDPLYAMTALAVSIVSFVVAYFLGLRIKSHFEIYSQIINVLDSIGLAVFTVGGINRAIECGFGENAFLTMFVGLITAVGGGVMRDVMAGRVPMILRKRVYALAAMAGAVVYYILIDKELLPGTVSALIGAGTVLLIRILATVFHWNLPTIKELADTPENKG